MSPLTRLDSYQGAEDQWRELLASSAADTLFLMPQWRRVWWEQFGDGQEMLLLSLQDNGAMEGLAPLSRRSGTITFMGSEDLFDYNDFPVSQGAESRFFPSLVSHLDREEWQALELLSLPEDSPTLAYLPDLARERGYQVEILEEDVAPGLELPGTWDDFLMGLSKKDRHELRRKTRRLYSAGIEVQSYGLSAPEEVQASLKDFFDLMRYSKEDKHRFLTPSRELFFQKIAMEMAGIGVMKLFFLELNKERVAAAMCFDYGRSRFLYNSGFNPDFGYYSVGLLLISLALKDAIEVGKTYFDFLRGDESYKYHLGGTNRTVYRMMVRRS